MRKPRKNFWFAGTAMIPVDSKVDSNRTRTPMSTLASLPSDVLATIFFPEVPLRSAALEMSLHCMTGLHVWYRRMRDVMYDLMRMRFFAYTSGPVLRSPKLTHMRDDGLPYPIPYWSYHQPMHSRYDTEYA